MRLVTFDGESCFHFFSGSCFHFIGDFLNGLVVFFCKCSGKLNIDGTAYLYNQRPNFPRSNNKTGILKVQAAYITVSIWVPLLPSNCCESIFPTFVDCDVEICEKICLNLFSFCLCIPMLRNVLA